MPDYTYLIVGGGMTADAAAQALHEADPVGSIGLISAEPHPPYDRPPLSKALWKGEPEEKIWRKTAASGAALHLGRRITAVDPRGAARRTTGAWCTGTRSCSSPPAAPRGACPSRPTRSSISAPSTTTAGCA